MATEQDLIEIPSEKAFDVFTKPGGVEPYIDIVRNAVADFVPSVETEADRALVRSTAFRITRSRTYLEKQGKAVADEQKRLPKLIDEARRRCKTELEALEETVRGPLTKWEADEKARKERHVAKIRDLEIIGATAGIGDTPETLRSQIEAAQAQEVSPEACEEFEDEYRLAKAKAVSKLREALAAREKYDADQAELARLRAAEEARKAEEAERLRLANVKEQQEAAEREQAKRVADAEQAARDQAIAQERAEAKRREDALRAEAQRREAEIAKAEADRKRLEQERAADRERERLAEERRAANKRHQVKVNNDAVAAIAKVLEEHGLLTLVATNDTRARAIITAVAQGKILNVSIKY